MTTSMTTTKLIPIEKLISEYKSNTLDSRDLSRLCIFLTPDECDELGIKFQEGYTHEKTVEYTRENILAQLKRDLAFAFEKALNKRGISAGMMLSVVSMWVWILNDNIPNTDGDTNYAQYGLPILKAVALHYGFDNPIGDDDGDEFIVQKLIISKL